VLEVLICTLDLPYLCNLEMTRLKQSEDQPFQRSGEQQTGRFLMQATASVGSKFAANQQWDEKQ
jgi:hypothetical protein